MHAEKMEEWNRKVRTLYTWSHLYLGFKVAQVHSRLLPEQKRAAFWKTRHSKFAQAMWSNIADLRGWWVKVGQFLSTRGDLLPDEYVSELSKVQDMMPTSPFPIIKSIIEDQLGMAVEDIFEWIEEKALASASIGQVHKAKLRPGARTLLRRCRPRRGLVDPAEPPNDCAPVPELNSPPDMFPHIGEGEVELADDEDEWGNEMVVLKVQHPNVDRMLLQDMELLKQLSWAFGLLEKGMNINEILEEWGKESRMELDFRYEAFNQKFVKRSIRQHRTDEEAQRVASPLESDSTATLLSDHLASVPIEDEVKIPAVLYASQKLLIMEYVNGFKCTDMAMLEKYKVDVNELCAKVVRSFADQIHIYGLFNADPHPGNIIIQLDPRGPKFEPIPVLLDWGLVKQFSHTQRIAFCKLIIAISQIDLMGLMRAFQDMGFKFKKKPKPNQKRSGGDAAEGGGGASASGSPPNERFTNEARGAGDRGHPHKLRNKLKIHRSNKRPSSDGEGRYEQGEHANDDPIPVDPEIYMDAITVLFKTSASGQDATSGVISQKDKDEAWAKAKDTKMTDVQSVNPLDDWPKDIIFFLRVASLLHGLTIQLKAQVPFFQIMLERAETAIRADMGIIPRYLQFVYKAHGATSSAAHYNVPYQDLVFSSILPAQPAEGLTGPPDLQPAVTVVSEGDGVELPDPTGPPGLPKQMPTKSSASGGAAFKIRSLLEWKLFKILVTFQGEGILVGCQVCVWHKKNQRADICIGRMGVYDSRPISQKTLFTAFSLTNVLMITMILYLVSKAKVKLSDCISEWWDGFIRGDKRMITISDLLTQQTGLHSWLPSTLTLNQLCNYNFMIKLAENAQPVCPQGQCGHYPHLCISYLYHHLLKSIVKQSPGKFLKNFCLKEWKLKHLSKLIYFPVEDKAAAPRSFYYDEDDAGCGPQPTTEFPSDLQDAKNTAQRGVSPEATTGGDPFTLLDTPVLEDPSPSPESVSDMPQVERDLVSGEGGTDPDSAAPLADEPLICKFVLDEDQLLRELDSIRKLEPSQIGVLVALDSEKMRQSSSMRNVTSGLSPIDQKQSTDFSKTAQDSLFARNQSLPYGLNASYGLQHSMSLSQPMLEATARSINPYAASGGDVFSRLATVSRDLGVAKIADSANMLRQTIGVKAPDEFVEEAAKVREEQRQEWLAKLREYKDEPPRPRTPDKNAHKGQPPPKVFLSKFTGRIALIEEYLKRKELATSKIVALQALLTQKAEGFSAFQLMQRRPHLLDPMFFNAEQIIPLDIPFANARISARAVATMLHYVSRGAVMREKILQNALKPRCLDLSIEARVATGGWIPLYGLGYQLLPLQKITCSESAKEVIVTSDNFELRHGPKLTEMPEVCYGARAMFKSALTTPKRAPIWHTANVRVDYKVSKSKVVPRPATVNAAARSIEDSAASEERKASTATSSESHDQETNKISTYAFGGSDTGGNLCFSVPSEQLSVCVLVNDHISGAHISRVVLQEVLHAFGLQPLNNLVSLPESFL